MNCIDIFGVKINNMNMNETVNAVKDLLKLNRPSLIFTPNSEILYLAKNDDEFKAILNSSDINTADGIGVVYAAKILNTPIPERVAGYDLSRELLKVMNKSKLKLFLFGGKPGVADIAAQKINEEYPDINICGTENGYFDSSDKIIEHINEKNPDFLFVCLGAPKQEKWIYENKDKLNCKVMMGIGGSLDVYANVAKRAPEFFIKLNMEWLYRLLKNPSRIGRMMSLPKFAFSVIKYKHKRKV